MNAWLNEKVFFPFRDRRDRLWHLRILFRVKKTYLTNIDQYKDTTPLSSTAKYYLTR